MTFHLLPGRYTLQMVHECWYCRKLLFWATLSVLSSWTALEWDWAIQDCDTIHWLIQPIRAFDITERWSTVMVFNNHKRKRLYATSRQNRVSTVLSTRRTVNRLFMPLGLPPSGGCYHKIWGLSGVKELISISGLFSLTGGTKSLQDQCCIILRISPPSDGTLVIWWW